MAAVLVPGVAQTALTGTVAGNPWAIILHWRFGTSTGPWASTDLNTLANTIMNSWKTRLASMMAVNVEFNNVAAVDIGSATPNVGNSSASAWAGTAGPVALTPGASWLMNFHIAARYRGGHPRCYIPGPSSNNCADGETVSTANQGVLNTAFAGIVGDVVTALPGSGAGAANHCVPRYTYTITDDPVHHKYLRTKSGVIAVYTVQSYSAHGKLAVQRRRNQTL